MPQNHATVSRRSVLAAASLAIPLFARAQAYPAQPVRMIVPYPAGGGADAVARLLAQHMSIGVGQSFVVENKPGAAGVIGNDYVAKSPKDGYTLLYAGTPFALSPALVAKLPYRTVEDFAAVTQTVRNPNLVLVPQNSPFETVQQLVAFGRANPGKLTYGATPGASQHLASALFASQTNMKMTFVPYKGGGQILTDLLGGHISTYFANAASGLPHVKAGKLRALATTSAARAPSLPDVPTVSETVIPGFQVYEWNGLLAPAGTPRAIVERLQAEAHRALRSPEMGESLAKLGAEPVGSRPEEFAAYLASEMQRWTAVAKANNIDLKE